MGNKSESGIATGEVFTRAVVVDYMLKEVFRAGKFTGWLSLHVLEPSCGAGAFVVPIVRLMSSEVADWKDPRLESFLVACDISQSNIEKTKRLTNDVLLKAGCPAKIARRLVEKWFVVCDYLLYDFNGTFDVVIGNPPYIRFDDLSFQQQRQYRERYKTFSERCDIYVPFFERSISLLSDIGVFSFICSNRFVKSSYGKKLRHFISDSFHVRLYLNMEHTQPFEETVSAYPAIFVIDRDVGQPTYAFSVSEITEATMNSLHTGTSPTCLDRFSRWYSHGDPWLTTNVAEFDEAEEINRIFPRVEESGFGTEVGIGVASGADGIFIDAHRNAPIEAQCLIPLVMSEDIQNGKIVWGNRYILNPYDPSDDSKMLPFDSYPKAAAYFSQCETMLKKRYCAKAHPDSWYRTLDRIRYDVWTRAKILLPDIQNGGNVALDMEGRFYPHHNVYWVSSKSWNLKALCVILRSSFVTNQIKWLSVQMRGGSIRYQAQNLRGVHIPEWKSLSDKEVQLLVALYDVMDRSLIDHTVDRIVRSAKRKQKLRYRQDDLF